MKKHLSRIVSVIFIFVTAFGICVGVYAADSQNDAAVEVLINKKSELYNDYIPQIEKVMTEVVNEKALTDGGSKYSQGQTDPIVSYNAAAAYRVTVLEPKLLTAVDKKYDIKAAATDTVQWKVPVTTESGAPGLAVLLEKDGVLSYLGMSVGEETNTWKIDDADILKAASEGVKFDGKIDSMQIYHSYMYNTTFVCFDGEKSDYIIPYSAYSKEIKLENGKMYKASDMFKKFDACFDEKLIESNPSYNGGAPFRTNTVSPLAVAAVCVLVAALIAVAVVLRRQAISKKRGAKQ